VAWELKAQKEKGTAAPPSAFPAPHNATPLPAPQQQQRQDWPDRKTLYELALLQVFATVFAALMVTGAIVVSGLMILRRLRQQPAALAPVDPLLTALAPLTPPGLSSAPEPSVEEGTTQPFDLGPTYEEYRRLEEEAQSQQEQAALQTIFEDNLRLQQMIELEPATA
jgi:hypothetical protein